jgi:hypothetical protein
MNLIELSNNLKDVPDHYLMNEVQQPTGAYPAYLVISELTRRKGMRDRALKNDPKSTVVEDLTQPNREQMMSAVAQMQQPAPQQQPLPPQMPMPPQMPPQIPQMPAAGLMATPQASSLAATDAMASPRKRMAGGGLVAFQEGGDVKRFAGEDGSYVAGDPSYYDPSPLSFLTNSRDQAIANLAAEKKKREDREAQARKDALLESAPGQVAYPKAITELPPAKDRLAAAEQSIRDQKAALAAQKQTPPSTKSAAPKVAQAAVVPVSPQQQIAFPAAPTDEQLAAAGQKAIGMFGQNVPQRFSETEKEIGKRTQNLKDRRKSALNEALMMAGIGVLKSKSPGRYFGEGAEEGMLAYRQSMKDVRGGEDLMTDAKQSLAHQQLLQDIAQQKVGQDAQQRALEMYKYGNEAAYQQGQLANIQEQLRMAGVKLPAEINTLNAQAEMMKERGDLYGRGGAGAVQSQMLTPALRSQAVKNATMSMIRQGIDANSEQYKTAFPQALYQAQQELMTQNPAAQGAAVPGLNAYLNIVQ